MTNTDINRPRLYTKAIIFIVTFFLNVFFGGILYCQNLYETGKKKDIPPVIIACLFWNYLSPRLLGYFAINDSALRLFIPNSTGAIIYITILWNYHFKAIKEYERRNGWIPIMVVISVYALFIVLNFLFIK
jgi:hypothetical protein